MTDEPRHEKPTTPHNDDSKIATVNVEWQRQFNNLKCGVLKDHGKN